MEADLGVQVDASSSVPLEAIKVSVEDEVDPLDAFMVDNSAQLVKEEQQPDEEIDPLDAFMTTQVLQQEKPAVAQAPAPQIKLKPDASWVINSRPSTIVSIKSTPVKPLVGRRAVRRRYSSGESSSEDDKASSEEEDDAVSLYVTEFYIRHLQCIKPLLLF